jgi:hypothetical protein
VGLEQLRSVLAAECHCIVLWPLCTVDY